MTPHLRPAAADLDEAGGLVVFDEGGRPVGHVSWTWRSWSADAASRCVMITTWLRPEHRGRGIGRRAQRELADLFFAHTRVHRVEASAAVENLAGQRSLEAAGFTREGVARGAQWRDGAYVDGVLFAVLRTDPR